MMKVSDPIIFGHAVKTYFAGVFEEHDEALREAGVNPNDGLGALLAAIDQLPPSSAMRSTSRSTPPTPTARPWRWSTPTAGSPTSTSPAT